VSVAGRPAGSAEPAGRTGGNAAGPAAAFVLTAMLVFTWLAWVRVGIDADRELESDFDYRVRDAERRIMLRMSAHEQVLRGAAGLVAGPPTVERSRFGAYVASLRLEEYLPGHLGVGYSLLVPAVELERHTQAVRREGFPAYAVHPSGVRDPYSAIVFIEPFTGRNLRAFGFDMLQEPVRRAAMVRARDEGTASLSGRVTLLQERDGDVQPGVLLYLAVYRAGPPPRTPLERRTRLLGWVYMPLRMGDLMQGILGERGPAELLVQLHDGAVGTGDRLLFDSDRFRGAAATGTARFEARPTLQVAGQTWTMVVRSGPAFGSRLTSPTRPVVAIGGLALALILSALTWVLASGRARAERRALDMHRGLLEAHASLKVSEQRFQFMADGAPVLIWMAGLDKGCTWVNRQWLEFTGRSLELERGNGWTEGVHADDLARFLEVYAGHFDRRQPFAMEYRLRRHDGQYRWLADTGRPMLDDAGNFSGFIGSCFDVTERVEAERRVSAAHGQAQATLDAMAAQLCVLDHRGQVVAVNLAWKAFGRANGAAEGCDFVGANYLDVCAGACGPGSEEAGPFRTGLTAVLAGRAQTFSIEYPCHAPGQERWFLGTVTRFHEGGDTWVVVSHVDLTARVRAERAVRDSQEHLRVAVLGGDLGLWDWDLPTGRVVFSERWAQMLGYTVGEVEPQVSSWERLVHPDDMPGVRALLDAHLQGETPHYSSEHRMRHKDGHWVWVLDCGAVVARGPDGTPLQVAGTHLDISSRKAAEAERAELLARSARAQRGAALGTLAAGMAHEINNPLTPVLAGIDFVKGQLQSLPESCLAAWRASALSSLDEVQGALDDAARGARRVRDLVADLRSFALGQHAADSQCELAGAVERAVRVAHHALADGTTISVDLEPVPPVAGSEAELVQLFACLLVNAEQATGDGPNQVRISAGLQGGRVVVQVSDTGKGIAPEHMPRIFEPFFTTRSVGQGKGLGLPVAQGIAQGLGGSIEVQSVAGRGTTVTVTLPVGGTG